MHIEFFFIFYTLTIEPVTFKDYNCSIRTQEIRKSWSRNPRNCSQGNFRWSWVNAEIKSIDKNHDHEIVENNIKTLRKMKRYNIYIYVLLGDFSSVISTFLFKFVSSWTLFETIYFLIEQGQRLFLKSH